MEEVQGKSRAKDFLCDFLSLRVRSSLREVCSGGQHVRGRTRILHWKKAMEIESHSFLPIITAFFLQKPFPWFFSLCFHRLPLPLSLSLYLGMANFFRGGRIHEV